MGCGKPHLFPKLVGNLNILRVSPINAFKLRAGQIQIKVRLGCHVTVPMLTARSFFPTGHVRHISFLEAIDLFVHCCKTALAETRIFLNRVIVLN